VPYTIEWRLWDVRYERRHLREWSKDRNKVLARELVDDRSATPDDGGALYGLLAAELRDWVTRGGERYSPVPDQVLDTYWKASRGLPGYYPPLHLGSGAQYLGVGSIGDIGEGVALAVLQDKGGLGLGVIARPIGRAPDFVLQDLVNRDQRPFAEVKTTEGKDPEGSLADAVRTALEILPRWHLHRDLSLTPALAVSVQVDPEQFNVEIIRLRAQDRLAAASPDPGTAYDTDKIDEARRATWAGDHAWAARALSEAGVGPATDKSVETAALQDELVSSAALLAVQDPDCRHAPEMYGIDKSNARTDKNRSPAVERALHKNQVHVSREVLDRATKLASKLLRAQETDKAAGGSEMRRREFQLDQPRVRDELAEVERHGGWRLTGALRGDGFMVRGYRVGPGVDLRSVEHPALRLPGHRARYGWHEGLEWTVFEDGRVQVWKPEGSRESKQDLLIEVGRVLAGWSPGEGAMW